MPLSDNDGGYCFGTRSNEEGKTAHLIMVAGGLLVHKPNNQLVRQVLLEIVMRQIWKKDQRNTKVCRAVVASGLRALVIAPVSEGITEFILELFPHQKWLHCVRCIYIILEGRFMDPSFELSTVCFSNEEYTKRFFFFGN